MAEPRRDRERGRGRDVLNGRAFATLLLLGPTGSGKTPLGQRLEERGLAGRRCLHFDFGAELRAAAAKPAGVPRLTAEDLRTIRLSLETGALLEDRDFPIAVTILDAFEERMSATEADILVLNGLPRHAGQAGMLADRILVRAVVVLQASVETVMERVRLDTGGDRGGRSDDRLGSIRARLETYRERTLPLIEFYEERGAAVVRIPVGARTRADEVRQLLEDSELLKIALAAGDPC